MEQPFTIFTYDPEVTEFTPAQIFLIKRIGIYVAQLLQAEGVTIKFPDGLINTASKAKDEYRFDDDGNLIRLKMNLDVRFEFKPEEPDPNKLF